MLRRTSLAVAIATLLSGTTVLAQDAVPQAGNDWYVQGQETLQERLSRQPNTSRAKNVILMVSDGNGVGSNYATRLWHGQQNGNFGDENVLPQESLPNLALVKTYNVNAQTPDSAGTATAMLTGVKTKAGVTNVNENVNRGDCSTVMDNAVTPITKMMSEAGKSVGILSTARLTHATPASGYANSADRNFEDDSSLPEGCEVPDIASQLIGAMSEGWVDIAMGGGRRHFLPAEVTDEEGQAGRRTDGANLVEQAQQAGAQYAFDDASFAELGSLEDGPILALFESSHMQYEFDRSGEPSLAEMVRASIEALQGNEQGFFLEVEAGRVDHANHAGNLHRAVTDGVAFADAVAVAMELTDAADTLLVVTADHEHAIAFNGYCGRGTPITGLCFGINGEGIEHTGVPELADDGRPYSVVGYLNGSGSVIRKEAIEGSMRPEGDDAPAPIGTDGDRVAQRLLDRLDVTTETDEAGASTDYRWIGARGPLTQEEATDPDFVQQAMLPKSSETHSGEDVAVYASGPFAHLFDGTIEQSFIFHVMHHAALGAE